jgi:RNA polymerase sigma factor (sigma-70 family)
VDHLKHDILLLKGLSRQESSSIEAIYKEAYPSVLNLITGFSGSADDASDVFQEAMIVLYEKSLDPDFELKSLIKTYLYAVCKRIWFKKWQREKRTEEWVEDNNLVTDSEEDWEKMMQKQDELARMEVALSSLGEPCKSLLEAFYFKKMAMHEIASSFNYTNADNAKTQKYKCLMRLKKLFFQEKKG